MIRVSINNKSSVQETFNANNCRPGTTVLNTAGAIELCVISNETGKHVWVKIDPATGCKPVVRDTSEAVKAEGRICDIDIIVTER